MANIEKVCGVCGGWDENNKQKYGNCYWCNIKNKYVRLNDKYSVCSNFFFQPDRQQGYKRNEFKPWGLHIITLVFHLLDLEGDEIIRDVINTGLDFKNSDNDLKDILFEEYDITGKIIAENINRYPEKIKAEIAKIIYNQYLKPMRELIADGKKQEALIMYLEMVINYKSSYNISGTLDIKYIIDILRLKNDELCMTFYNELEDNENAFDELFTIKDYFEKCKNSHTQFLYKQVCKSFDNIFNTCTDSESLTNIIQKYYEDFIKQILIPIKEDVNKYTDVNRKVQYVLENTLNLLNTEQLSNDNFVRKLDY